MPLILLLHKVSKTKWKALSKVTKRITSVIKRLLSTIKLFSNRCDSALEKALATKLPDLKMESLIIIRELRNLLRIPEVIEDLRQAMVLIRQIKMPNGQVSSLIRNLNKYQ